MRPLRLLRHLPTLFAVAAALAIAPPVSARAAALSVQGTELHAGETVEVRWSGLPAECGELEILLSVDGGLTYPLRVSAELEPREGGFHWRVPNLAAARARLRLRYGVEHRELESPPTEPFRIVADPEAPPTDFHYREGDWWERFECAAAPSAGDLGAPAFSDRAERTDCAPPRAGAAAPEPVRAIVLAPRPASAPATPARRTSCNPRVVPMRS